LPAAGIGLLPTRVRAREREAHFQLGPNQQLLPLFNGLTSFRVIYSVTVFLESENQGAGFINEIIPVSTV
jgi:hypothetical protein